MSDSDSRIKVLLVSLFHLRRRCYKAKVACGGSSLSDTHDESLFLKSSEHGLGTNVIASYKRSAKYDAVFIQTYSETGEKVSQILGAQCCTQDSKLGVE
jgi:hypothetical protein